MNRSEPSPGPLPDLFTLPDASVSVGWLETMLRNAGRWMTAREIVLAARGTVSDRLIREMASSSDWIISGQKGYKHVDIASTDETVHASNWLVSQGKWMIKRGLRIRRNAHRRIG